MRKIKALVLSLTVLAAPFAMIDGYRSDAEAASYRLKHTKKTCTSNHTTGMTSCITVVWYTNAR
ncbi:MAG: hypothetical protein ACRCTI_02595 [Beijerinckiaceae bacterium]